MRSLMILGSLDLFRHFLHELCPCLGCFSNTTFHFQESSNHTFTSEHVTWCTSVSVHIHTHPFCLSKW